MTPGEVRALEDCVCLAHPKLLPIDAHKRSQRVAGVTAYRCPFSKHWHAEALTIETMLQIAEMLRERGGGASLLVTERQAH